MEVSVVNMLDLDQDVGQPKFKPCPHIFSLNKN